MGLAAESPDQVSEELVTTLGGGPERFEMPPHGKGAEQQHCLPLSPGQSHHLAHHRAPYTLPPSFPSLQLSIQRSSALGGSAHIAGLIVGAQLMLKN